MIEAALVLPLVMAAAMLVLYISIALYMETANSASLHQAIRNEAVLLSETGHLDPELADYLPSDTYGRQASTESKSIRITPGLYFDSIVGNSQTNKRIPGLFGKKMHMQTDAKIYIIKETEYIRCLDLI